MTWQAQVSHQAARANKLLGFVRRNSRFIHSTSVRRTLYLRLVRAHLGYATQVWAPQGIELISKLQSIQRRATKFILCLPFLTRISYKERLMSVNLLPVCYWHELLDLVYFYKVTHNMIHLDPSVGRCMTFADYRLQTADCRLQTADCRLQTTDCRPQIADCKLKDTKNLPNKGDTIKNITSCESEKVAKLASFPRCCWLFFADATLY